MSRRSLCFLALFACLLAAVHAEEASAEQYPAPVMQQNPYANVYPDQESAFGFAPQAVPQPVPEAAPVPSEVLAERFVQQYSQSLQGQDLGPQQRPISYGMMYPQFQQVAPAGGYAPYNAVPMPPQLPAMQPLGGAVPVMPQAPAAPTNAYHQADVLRFAAQRMEYEDRDNKHRPPSKLEEAHRRRSDSSFVSIHETDKSKAAMHATPLAENAAPDQDAKQKPEVNADKPEQEQEQEQEEQGQEQEQEEASEQSDNTEEFPRFKTKKGGRGARRLRAKVYKGKQLANPPKGAIPCGKKGSQCKLTSKLSAQGKPFPLTSVEKAQREIKNVANKKRNDLIPSDLVDEEKSFEKNKRTLKKEQRWIQKVVQIVGAYQNKIAQVRDHIQKTASELKKSQSKIEKRKKEVAAQLLQKQLEKSMNALRALESRTMHLNSKISTLQNSRRSLMGTIMKLEGGLLKHTGADQPATALRFRALNEFGPRVISTGQQVVPTIAAPGNQLLGEFLQMMERQHLTNSNAVAHQAARPPAPEVRGFLTVADQKLADLERFGKLDPIREHMADTSALEEMTNALQKTISTQ